MRTLAAILLLGIVSAPAAALGRPVWAGVRWASDDQPVEKRSWVGVAVSPAPASLRHQLKLSEGVGLVVEFVQPGSPAAGAELKPFDVLLKLDDQWLINPEQFAVLVHMRHPGDEVKLTFLRDGAEHSASVKLVEHATPRAPQWDGNFAWPEPPAPPALPGRGHGPGHVSGQTIVTWLDDHREMCVTTADGHRTLSVKENGTGKVLFDGPIDTDEQRAHLPPDIRRALDDMNRATAALESRRRQQRSDSSASDPTTKPSAAAPQPQSP